MMLPQRTLRAIESAGHAIGEGSAVVSTSVALTRDPLADELPGGGQKGRLLAVSQGLGVRFGAVESCLEQFGEVLCEGERE